MHKKTKLSWLMIASTVILLGGCDQEREYPSRPITLVCPWAAGGGTDLVSRQIAAHLESELNVPVNVINATGGKGVTGHNRGLRARPDGYTLTMATLELSTMHWSGLTSLTYRDCIPLISVNEDYAALFVRQDAPWQTLASLEAEIRKRPGQLKASGTTTGGAWHVALAGWLLAAELQPDAVIWISETGAAPSLQELISGGLDMVCCSLPEARTLFEAGEIRSLGVMAPDRAVGFESVATFAEQGTDCSFGGWRALAVPPNTPAEVVNRLLPALEKVVTGETTVAGTTFPAYMKSSGFNNTWRKLDELEGFLAETDEKFGRMLTSEAMKSVNVDRISPMAFPWMILALMGVVLIGVFVQHAFGSGVVESSAKTDATEPTWRGRISFLLVLVTVVAYLLLAETVGFVLVSVVCLFVLSCWFGAGVGVSGLIAVVLSPAVYQFFSHILRVPLPRGWLGW